MWRAIAGLPGVRLYKMEEGIYRLPTEAEWEYAARAGSTTAFANGGITKTGCGYDANLNDMGWYCNNGCINYDSKFDRCLSGSPCSNCGPNPVAQKSPNAWGLYDMHGSVFEWCQDWYGEYPTGNVTDPIGPATGSSRVMRGGSWQLGGAEHCRSASRYSGIPDSPGSDMIHSFYGFRLVREP